MLLQEGKGIHINYSVVITTIVYNAVMFYYIQTSPGNSTGMMLKLSMRKRAIIGKVMALSSILFLWTILIVTILLYHIPQHVS